jgi:uncharacterized pyridoxal phosphate-containing UPF0001 family protein
MFPFVAQAVSKFRSANSIQNFLVIGQMQARETYVQYFHPRTNGS